MWPPSAVPFSCTTAEGCQRHSQRICQPAGPSDGGICLCTQPFLPIPALQWAVPHSQLLLLHTLLQGAAAKPMPLTEHKGLPSTSTLRCRGPAAATPMPLSVHKGCHINVYLLCRAPAEPAMRLSSPFCADPLQSPSLTFSSPLCRAPAESLCHRPACAVPQPAQAPAVPRGRPAKCSQWVLFPQAGHPEGTRGRPHAEVAETGHQVRLYLGGHSTRGSADSRNKTQTLICCSGCVVEIESKWQGFQGYNLLGSHAAE